jgi:hypothetical protein
MTMTHAHTPATAAPLRERFWRWFATSKRRARQASRDAMLAALSPTDRAAFLTAEADSLRDAIAKSED